MIKKGKPGCSPPSQFRWLYVLQSICHWVVGDPDQGGLAQIAAPWCPKSGKIVKFRGNKQTMRKLFLAHRENSFVALKQFSVSNLPISRNSQRGIFAHIAHLPRSFWPASNITNSINTFFSFVIIIGKNDWSTKYFAILRLLLNKAFWNILCICTGCPRKSIAVSGLTEHYPIFHFPFVRPSFVKGVTYQLFSIIGWFRP